MDPTRCFGHYEAQAKCQGRLPGLTRIRGNSRGQVIDNDVLMDRTNDAIRSVAQRDGAGVVVPEFRHIADCLRWDFETMKIAGKQSFASVLDGSDVRNESDPNATNVQAGTLVHDREQVASPSGEMERPPDNRLELSGATVCTENTPAPPPRREPTLRGRFAMFVMAVRIAVAGARRRTIWQQHRAERSRAQDALIDRAHAMALLVDREFTGAKHVLDVLAGAQTLRRGDLPGFWVEMQAAAAATGAPVINLIGPDKYILLSTKWQPGQHRQVMARRPATSKLASGNPSSATFTTAPPLTPPAVAVVVPVPASGEVADGPYALGLVMPGEQLTASLPEQRLPPGAVATVMDRDKVVVTRTLRARGDGRSADRQGACRHHDRRRRHGARQLPLARRRRGCCRLCPRAGDRVRVKIS